MDVSLGFDARPAEEGFSRFQRAGLDAIALAERVEQAAQRIGQSFSAIGQGASSFGLQGATQQVQATTTALNEQAQAQTRATQATVASGQAMQSASAFAQRFDDALARVEGGLGEVERATAGLTREQARQLQQSLTLLSTLGGADRAYSQQTTALIRYGEGQGQVVRTTQLLSEVQERARQSIGRAGEVFSTSAVNARDLRLNMANLSQQMTVLAGASGAALQPLLNISQVVRQIRTAMAGSSLFGAGGAAAGGSGLDRFGDAATVGVLARIVPVATAATAALAAVGVVGMGAIVREGAKAEVEIARLEGVIRATGGAAGVTAQQVDRLSESIAVRTGVAAAELNRAAAQLLTFRSVAGESFERAIGLSADLSVVFGSVSSAALQLGKALEDPETGLTALRRSGISFTQAQRDLIVELVETNRLAEAQALILDTVQRQVGGTADAIGNTMTGAFQRMREAIGNALEAANQWLGLTNPLKAMAETVANAAQTGADALGQLAERANDPRLRLTGVNAEIARLEAERSSAAGPTRIGVSAVIDERGMIDRQLAELRRERDQLFKAVFERGNADPAADARLAQEQRQAEQTAARLVELEKQYGTVAEKARSYQTALADINTLAQAGNITEAERAALIKQTAERIFGAAQAETGRASATRSTAAAVKSAIDEEAAARAKAEQSLSDYLRGLAVQNGLSRLDADTRAVVTAQIEAQTRAQRQLTQEELAGIEASIRSRREGEEKRRVDEEAARTATREAQRAQEEAAKLAQEPFLQAARNIQDAFADTFQSIFSGGIDSFSDLASRVKDIFIDLAAQIAGLLVFRPQVLSQGGLAGIAGPLGGILGSTGGQLGAGGVGPPTPGTGLLGLLGKIPGLGAIGGFLGPAGIGAGIGSLLGAGSGNGLVDTGASLLGGIGGGLLGGSVVGPALLGAATGPGALFALGAFAGPIGALLGGLVGILGSTLLKGLFEQDIKFPSLALATRAEGGGVGFSKGFSLEGPFGFVGADSPRTSGGDVDVRSVTRTFRAFDEQIAERLTPGQIAGAAGALQSSTAFQVTQLNNSMGRELFPVIIDRLNTIFQGAFGAETVSNQFLSDEFGVPQNILKAFTNRGIALTGAVGALIPGALDKGKVTDESGEKLVAAALQILQEREQAVALIDDLLGRASPVSEAKAALDAINKAWAEFIKNADRLAFSEQELADARSAQQAAIRRVQTDFLDSLADQILAIEDPAALAVRELDRWRESIQQSALDLGLSAEEQARALLDIETLYGLRRVQIAEQFAQQANSQIADSFRRLTDQMFRSTSSPLDPTIVFNNTRAQAEQDFLAGLIGGTGSDALGRLPQSLSAFLDSAQAIFASGPGFADAFNWVTGLLETVQTVTGVDVGLPTGASGASFASLDGHIVDMSAELAAGNRRQQEDNQDILEELRALRQTVAQQQRQLSLLLSAPEPAVAG